MGPPHPIYAGKTGVVRWNNGWVGGTGGSRTVPYGRRMMSGTQKGFPPSPRGQALTFPHHGGRDL